MIEFEKLSTYCETPIQINMRLQDGSGIIPLSSEGQFIASRDTLNLNVLFRDAGRGQTLFGSVNEGVDDPTVPARMDDADSKSRA